MNDERLYDHYKDTNELCRNSQKQRDRYFFLMSIAIFVLLLLSAYPTETVSMIEAGVQEAAGFTPTLGMHVIQSFCWMLYLWVTLRYYQRSVYVERTYTYIDTLEKKLGITREGSAYAESYPAVLNVIHWVYQWFYPVMILLATVTKVVWEYHTKLSTVFLVVDMAAATFIVLTTILYWLFVHPLPKRNNKK